MGLRNHNPQQNHHSACKEKLKITSPLLSYCLNDNRDAAGLIDLGFADITDQGRKKIARLAEMDRLLVKSYL